MEYFGETCSIMMGQWTIVYVSIEHMYRTLDHFEAAMEQSDDSVNHCDGTMNHHHEIIDL